MWVMLLNVRKTKSQIAAVYSRIQRGLLTSADSAPLPELADLTVILPLFLHSKKKIVGQT